MINCRACEMADYELGTGKVYCKKLHTYCHVVDSDNHNLDRSILFMEPDEGVCEGNIQTKFLDN